MSRFTDAELAAEYWRADSISRTLAAIAENVEDVSTTRGAVEESYRNYYSASTRVLDTIHRFATTPHFDEVTP